MNLDDRRHRRQGPARRQWDYVSFVIYAVILSTPAYSQGLAARSSTRKPAASRTHESGSSEPNNSTFRIEAEYRPVCSASDVMTTLPLSGQARKVA